MHHSYKQHIKEPGSFKTCNRLVRIRDTKVRKRTAFAHSGPPSLRLRRAGLPESRFCGRQARLRWLCGGQAFSHSSLRVSAGLIPAARMVSVLVVTRATTAAPMAETNSIQG